MEINVIKAGGEQSHPHKVRVVICGAASDSEPRWSHWVHSLVYSWNLLNQLFKASCKHKISIRLTFNCILAHSSIPIIWWFCMVLPLFPLLPGFVSELSGFFPGLRLMGFSKSFVGLRLRRKTISLFFVEFSLHSLCSFGLRPNARVSNSADDMASPSGMVFQL